MPTHHYSAPALGGERVVYLSKDGRLGCAPLAGGPFTAVTELPADFQYSYAALSSCGRYAAVIYTEMNHAPRARNLLGGRFGEYPSAGSERDNFGGRGLLLWVDLDTGMSKGITGGRLMDHPRISPADPYLMGYCNMGDWKQIQRMMTARFHEAANFIEVKPLFVQRPGLDAVGHEIFLADGRVAAIWMEYEKIGDDAEKPKRSAILVVDPATGKHVAYDTPGLIFNHLHGRDGKVFVSEGRSEILLKDREPQPDRNNMNLGDLLVRYVVQGKRTVPTVLCVLQGTRKSHAHTVLDRENRHAYFNGSPDGQELAVFRVNME